MLASRSYFQHIPVLVTASIVGWLLPSTMEDVYYIDKAGTYPNSTASGTHKVHSGSLAGPIKL